MLSSAHHTTTNLLLRARVVLTRVPVVLVGRLLETRLVLGLAAHSVVREAAEPVVRLATASDVVGGGGLAEGAVAEAGGGDVVCETAGAHVDSALVGRVPVRGDGGFFRERKVGLALFDDFLLGGHGVRVVAGEVSMCVALRACRVHEGLECRYRSTQKSRLT